MEENNQLKLVKSLMDKNKETLGTHKAEMFIELQANKDAMVDEVQKVTNAIDGLQENIDMMETKMQKANLEKSKSMKSTIYNQLTTPPVKGKPAFSDMLTNWDQKKGSNHFAFTTSLTENQIVIHDPTSFVSGNSPVVLPFREAGVDKAPVRPPAVSDLIQWGTTTSNKVDWVERTDKTEGAAARAENAIMGQGDMEYTEVDTPVKIMSEYMKATNESLKDVDFLASEINSELLSDLRLLVDSQLLAGDGITVNLLGIIPQAVTFAAGSFATAIVLPNNADVLRVAINQIILAGKGRWFPSAILMNPDDVTALDVLKIADGRYIEIPYYNAETASVLRVPIYQNTGITAGDFLVGDFMKAKAFVRDALTVRIFDQNSDDPIYNRSTITANIRLAFRIKNQEKAAFVTGDFATAIAALATV